MAKLNPRIIIEKMDDYKRFLEGYPNSSDDYHTFIEALASKGIDASNIDIWYDRMSGDTICKRGCNIEFRYNELQMKEMFLQRCEEVGIDIIDATFGQYFVFLVGLIEKHFSPPVETNE